MSRRWIAMKGIPDFTGNRCCRWKWTGKRCPPLCAAFMSAYPEHPGAALGHPPISEYRQCFLFDIFLHGGDVRSIPSPLLSDGIAYLHWYYRAIRLPASLLRNSFLLFRILFPYTWDRRYWLSPVDITPLHNMTSS